ncbi:MAG: hypothetical protein PF484_11365 [Bacteroidales bacterium]|jgi:hypothetical protein|nr:hypothetical protein [Bacteroidales bacterium]
MNSLNRRKQAFIKLGKYLDIFSDSMTMNQKFLKLIEELEPNYQKKLQLIHEQILEYIENSVHFNAWFTKDFLIQAIKSIGESLTTEKMNLWLEKHENDINSLKTPKTIGVVMAGNLPLVGFHDYLCVLISGHNILAKLSKDDSKLLPLLQQVLASFEPELENKANFTQETLTDFDAIIATGSDNTARYFEYYFGKYPNIIRKNRNGIAVLNGKETDIELENLSNDIFMYFGLGCRNVSKLFVPKGYSFDKLFEAFNKYSHLTHHNKYTNNYDYNKSIYLINKIKYLDNGFVLLKEDVLFSSPISVLYFEYYESLEDLNKLIYNQKDKIQCLVSKESFKKIEHLPIGKAQQPKLWDYADGIDTLQFILNLN